MACGKFVPWPGLIPESSEWEGEFLTPGAPGKSWHACLNKKFKTVYKLELVSEFNIVANYRYNTGSNYSCTYWQQTNEYLKFNYNSVVCDIILIAIMNHPASSLVGPALP